MADKYRKPRVLVANIYFAPNSFGGATIVAENMALKLRDEHGWDVVVLCGIDDPEMSDYSFRRYQAKGLDIIGVKIPSINPQSDTNWSNPQFLREFNLVLEHVAPDIVHFHAIQNMGADIIAACRDAGVPSAVTVHDCWYLCERQFMINHAGRYCFQEKIDLEVCRFCVPDLQMTKRRLPALVAALNNADIILYPSEFQRSLFVANGIDEGKSIVNKNGIRRPESSYSRKPNLNPETHRLRFGFVGGPGPIKGASIMARAFKSLKRTDYELRIVDAAGNIGETWEKDPVWNDIPGTVTFVPPYDQSTIDDVFSEIDVLLFPSQWKESFGLTVREAMVRGVWPVASDAGGLAEDCHDGINASVIPMTADHTVLAAQIEALL